MTAKELLSVLQLSGERVRSNSDYLEKLKRELRSEEYATIIERISRNNQRMPTDFQDSYYYDKISLIFKILEDTVREHTFYFNEVPIPAKPIPLFGTVASSGYNALISPSDEPVIAFNDNLLNFTNRILHIYTIEHWLAASKQLSPETKDMLTRNFIDMMVCYACGVDLTYVLPIEVCNADNWDEFKEYNIPEETIEPLSCIYDERYIKFAEDVEASAYLWIVAHEYAHLLLGHIDSGNKNVVTRYLNDIPVEEVYLQWKEEFDADFLAASIVMASDYSYYKISGIYLALMSLKLSGIDKEHHGISSHPPVSKRFANLLKFVESEPRYGVACKNIDTVIIPKFTEFRKFLGHIDSAGIVFSNEGDIQKYIYTKYPLRNRGA